MACVCADFKTPFLFSSTLAVSPLAPGTGSARRRPMRTEMPPEPTNQSAGWVAFLLHACHAPHPCKAVGTLQGLWVEREARGGKGVKGGENWKIWGVKKGEKWKCCARWIWPGLRADWCSKWTSSKAPRSIKCLHYISTFYLIWFGLAPPFPLMAEGCVIVLNILS